MTSSTEHHCGRGSAAPPSSRERSSRLSISRDSRVLSSVMTLPSSRRSSSDSVGEAIASPAATIAVSGERRSCETARSSVVLTTSARRSARVSTTSPSRRSRSRPAASSASRLGTTRSCSRRSASSGSPAGTSSVPSWVVPSRSGNATRPSSPSTGASSIAADGRPSADASRCAAAGSDSDSSLPRSSSRAISAARSASRRRWSASVARARATCATELPITRDDQEHDQRDPVLALGDREAPRRRDVEEVERQRRRERGQHAEPRAPDRRDDEHRDEVDDAERDHRRDLAEREHQRGRARDDEHGGHHAQDPRRRRHRQDGWPSAARHAPTLARALDVGDRLIADARECAGARARPRPL